MERVDFPNFKKEALKDSEVRGEYEKPKPIYELRKQLIALRKNAGLTQEKVAERLHTKKINISRLESANSKSSPWPSAHPAFAGGRMSAGRCLQKARKRIIKKKSAIHGL